MKNTRDNRFLFILAFSAAIITFAVFLPSLQNGFVNWDDNIYVYDNPGIQKLDLQFLFRAFSEFHASGNWHPLTLISHALDYALWGLNPLGHHLTNNILHAANTFLVVLLVARLMGAVRYASTPVTRGGSPGRAGMPGAGDSRFTLIAAAATGLLFGLHPLHVESVAWVSERKDVLYAFFFLLALLSYIKYAGTAEERQRPGYISRPYLSTAGYFVLALLSKPMAVTLPAVLLVLDWYPFERIRSFKTFRAAFIEKLPFFGLSLAASVLAILAQRSSEALISVELAPLPVRLAVAFESVFSYLGKMVFPVNLLPFYPYPENASLLSPKYLIFVVLAVGVSMACLAAMKKQKVWLAAWGYYLITLLPVIGIIQAGFQAKADRYTYLPSLGPFLIISLAAAWVYDKIEKRQMAILKPAAAVMAVILLTLMSYATIKQTGIWKNSLVLWNYLLEKEPDRIPTAYYNRGKALDQMNQLDSAIKDYDRAITLKPDYFQAYNNRGVNYDKKGLLDKAVEDFTKAIKLKQDYSRAYNNRGFTYGKLGLFDKAIGDFTKAVESDPTYSKAYLNRGYLYLRTGNPLSAVPDLRKACSLGNESGCKALQTLEKN